MEIKLEINDLKNLFRRRKKFFIIPFAWIFITALVVSYSLPPVYRSEATILVEGQKISEDYVTTPTTSFVEERIGTITRQIMSRKNLMEIINQYNLYPKMREKATDITLFNKLREDILLETIDADVYNRKSGRQIVATIAFTLSYQGNDPSTVQKVTNKLASLYLEKDLIERERNASYTTSIFQDELGEVKHKIKKYEEEISKFKIAHFDEMPEHNALTIQAVAQLEKEYDRLHIQIRALKNKKANLEGRLAGVDPSTTTVVDGKSMLLNPKDRLKQLRIQLLNLRSTLSDKHPDIKRLKREINKLEPVDENEAGTSTKQEKPDNPAYISLQSQIIAARSEINALRQEQKKLKIKIDKYRRKIIGAPLVEKEYSELTRDYESDRQRYREIADNLMKLKFAQAMDETQQATNFSILEAAYFPQKPSKPNRKAIVLLGFLVAFSMGSSFALFKEYTDRSIKTKDELERLTTIPVFAVIPFLEQCGRSRARKIILPFATVLIVFASLWLMHRYISPIDMLWA